MFLAALTSLSWTVPQSSQVHSLIPRSAIPFGLEDGRQPHSEQTWELCASEVSTVPPPFPMDL
jgi:hypothetical protein